MKSKIFVVSGIHPVLPYYEILSVLDTYNLPYKIRYIYNQVISLIVSRKALDIVKERTALTHICGYELIEPSNSLNDLLEKIYEINWEEIIDGTFAVRVKKIGNIDIDSIYVEKGIGKIIHNLSHRKVRLENPDTLLLVIITENKYILCKVEYIVKKNFGNYFKDKKIFTHMTTLSPKFVKVLINIGMVKSGKEDVFLDPFVGTGSVLIGASHLSKYVIGIDISLKMCKRCLSNLRVLNIFLSDIICGDSKNLPLRNNSVNYIITDPPYGRKAPLYNVDLNTLLSYFLRECKRILRENGVLTLITPEDIEITKLIQEYVKKFEFKVRMHRNLTRRITILLKKGKLKYKL